MPKFSVPNSGVLVVLAVLLGEYIIMALPRAVIPKYQAAAFEEDVITVAAVTEAVKGVFALISNLTLGQLSDSWGRKTLLLITATGTVLPQALLAFSDNMWAYQVIAISAPAATSTCDLGDRIVGRVGTLWHVCCDVVGHTCNNY